MNQVIVSALLGLGSATLFAGLAVALVVQYRATGMINLSAGAIATFAAYIFYWLKVEHAWGTAPAFAAGLLGCVLLGVLFELAVVRRLRGAPPLAKLVASLGLLLLLQALFLLAFGTTAKTAPALLDTGLTSAVRVFGTPIPTDRLYVTGILVVVTGIVALGYRYSRMGLSTTAVAENEGGAILFGIPAQRISLYSTVLATVLAGGLGMLIASQSQLDPTTMSLAIVPALAAALLGGFTSFIVSAAAGLAIGIVQAALVFLQTKPWFPTVQSTPLPGVAQLFTFVVVVGALWLRGAKLPVRGTTRERRLPPAPEPRRIATSTVALTGACVVLVLLVPAAFRQGLMNSLAGIVICLSLVVIIGYVGQISLMNLALAGVAAFAVQKLTVTAGLGFPLAPILAVAVAILFGLVAAVPSLRLRGVTLAIATLAAAVAFQEFVFKNSTFGQEGGGSFLPAPSLFGLRLGPEADFPGWDGKLPSPVPVLACVLAAAVIAVVVATLRRSTFGQHLMAVRANEGAAAAVGVNVRNAKLIAFAISAGMAGVAGVMTAYSFGGVAASEFDVWIGLSLIAFAYIGGVTTISGAIIAGLAFPGGLGGVALQSWTGLSADWLSLAGGAALLATVVVRPEGLALAHAEQLRSLGSRIGRFRQRAPAGRGGDKAGVLEE